MCHMEEARIQGSGSFELLRCRLNLETQTRKRLDNQATQIVMLQIDIKFHKYVEVTISMLNSYLE